MEESTRHKWANCLVLSVLFVVPALQSSAKPNSQTTQPKGITSVKSISVKQTNSPLTPTTYSYSPSQSSTATSVIQSTEAPTTSGSLLMNSALLGLTTTPNPTTTQDVTTYTISSKLMARLTTNSYSSNLSSSTGSSRQSSSGLFGIYLVLIVSDFLTASNFICIK